MIFDPVGKLLWNGDRVKEWLETGRTRPVLVEIAPTAFCSASCPWCFFRNRKNDISIDSHKMMEILEDLVAIGIKAINWTGGGEPTLHLHFKDFVAGADQLGIKQGLFTNGYQEIPLQDKFTWIRISLTNGGLKKIIKPDVPFGICVNQIYEQTEKDLRNLCEDAQKIGARYFQIRPALSGDCAHQPDLIQPGYLKEYARKGFDVYVTEYKYRECIRDKDYGKCYGYFFCPSIDWEARLSTCLYLSGDKRFVLADLKSHRLVDAWPKIKKDVFVIPGCQNCCKNHEINKVLDAAQNIEMTDFI
jgi:hypothetical protein